MYPALKCDNLPGVRQAQLVAMVCPSHFTLPLKTMHLGGYSGEFQRKFQIRLDSERNHRQTAQIQLLAFSAAMP
jgi:hypothetical protein